MKLLFMRALVWICILSVSKLLSLEHIEGYLTAAEEVGFRGTTETSVTYKYDRIGEVKRQCGFVLKSASQLKPDDSRIFSIKEELYFLNGDWEQDGGDAPILPFDDREAPKDGFVRAPLKLASFWVVDVDRSHRSKKAVFVSGLMSMGITREGTFSEKPYEGSREFEIWAGHTRLLITFQGVYTESLANRGERVLCLLGSTMLPSRETDSGNPWKWVEDFRSNFNTPPLSQDDQIMLVLRYPINFTLTERLIRGTLKSLNPKSNSNYFDEAKILSQLGQGAHYEFGSEKEILVKSCDPYPYRDNFLSEGIEIYKGPEFCRILDEATRGQALTVVPNWKCNGKDEFCSKLGPFGLDREIKATDGGFKNVRLYMQDIKCEQEHVGGNITSSRVAAVFRAVPPDENQYSAAVRSGPSNMTIASEGIWESPSGQLCMIGCLGSDNAGGKGCDSRVCLYVPTSFSIQQRSILVGSFSSMNNNTPAFFPLSFEKLVQPAELWNYFKTSNPKYTYSKIDSAGVILEKNEAFSFGTVIKKSLLQFPRLGDAASYFLSLSYLSEDLALHVSAIPDPFVGPRSSRIDLQMEIISLGPLFGRYWSLQNETHEQSSFFHAKTQYTEKQLLLNVSSQLSFSAKGSTVSSLSTIFLEGLYDPHVGRMYLVGCRDIRVSWQILSESMDLESGLDCLIEVVVSYPPTTARWLINPTARISVSSQRTEDDPLYFKPVKLQTLPILYRQQREDILSERGVEGILRILTLSAGIAFILAQLFYINSNSEFVPFVSLVMLGVQAFGYSLPLITGAEAVFKRTKSESSVGMLSYNIGRSQWFHVIDYAVKLLVMVSFVLTLWLFQKVWKSRSRLHSRAPSEVENSGIPSDKQVLVTTLIVHITGYGSVLIGHALKSHGESSQTEIYFDSSTRSRLWETKLEEYVGLAHDFFLLPQVIGNLIWQIETKPLRKLYYMGITVVRLLPHFYDFIRAPRSNPYMVEEYEFVNPNMDFFSKLGDLAIPIIAVLLAVMVYVQQRWDYEKLREVLRLGRFMVLPARSRAYQRLPSKVSETELVPGVNGNQSHTDE
ncbi:uncharacterized protein LOC116207752 [Punica granatum]|uniref:RING-type E3 ubiquitin transferase n=2 Tax=Punica granatum TaxID=22663 RepID=A0A218XC52_PUNGR|nr:uncharacterized protein LOC116207752 [Punica granatum]OWM82300.1 hypothetical protein CDL15_Pgr001874 [Punica granatum]PKI62071.1 hypothetical protein CRG98_017444 [Punica granatum]